MGAVVRDNDCCHAFKCIGNIALKSEGFGHVSHTFQIARDGPAIGGIMRVQKDSFGAPRSMGSEAELGTPYPPPVG